MVHVFDLIFVGISELCAVPWFCCDYIYQRDFRNSP